MRGAVSACAMLLVVAAASPARADVGGSVRATLARLETAAPLAHATLTHARLARGGTERWKFATGEGEARIYVVDGSGIDGAVIEERYIRMTERDPFSFAPGARGGNDDLDEVISLEQRRDFDGAHRVALVTEAPLRLTAAFYRGAHAAYEVLAPIARTRGIPSRFEWRSFAPAALPAAIAAARACDNGEDCAAW